MSTTLVMLGTNQKVCHSEKGRGADKRQKLMSQEVTLL